MTGSKEMLNQKNNSSEKWYDTPQLVDVLLFLFPPLGLLALYKSEKLVPKGGKIIVGFTVFAGIIYGLITII